METVKCPTCGKLYQFSEEQLSKSEKIIFPCLGCKKPITFERPSNLIGDEIQSMVKTSGNNLAINSLKNDEIELADVERLKKKIFHTLDKLPSMSQVVYKALEIMADPDSEIQDIANAIETDQSMVSNILRIVNSAYYGVKIKISSIQRACFMLGKHTLREIIIMAGVSNLLKKNLKGYGFASGELWTHSIASAFGAKIIAGKGSSYNENDAYVAGLIHDVGKIILDPYIWDRIDVFEEVMRDGNETALNAERNTLGFDHAEIASEICAKWNFPENIALAIRHHHHPSLSQGDKLSYLVHMANFIARSCGFGYGREGSTTQLEEGTVDFLSLETKRHK